MYPSGVWQNRRWLHFLCQMLLFKRHRKWMMEGDSSGGACCSRDTQEVNDEGWHLRRGLLLAQRGGVIRLSNWLMGITSYTASLAILKINTRFQNLDLERKKSWQFFFCGWQNHETAKPRNLSSSRWPRVVSKTMKPRDHETTKPWNLSSSRSPRVLSKTMKPRNYETTKL